ncbi:protein-tyrosine-phosphatase [Winogradskyella sp. PC-19]|uniref:low molecular weight protein-tyrosine-phosphatase n=1 Tax=unclassified Winogradskyella TaxID=2615021 RepID=UPI000B3D2B55|nr:MULTISPECIES: low molecular weight protein-tyrosine-phosphatase [unclassified Winogradskyella]ARV08116.1 protein-tyrosine-phosphatase [Winogradskyella sp. PC-19]
MPSKPSKTKILVVCLGNICRSPLAHGILESKLPSEDFFIDSAGTASYHIGNQPDVRSMAIAKTNGIDISHQKARQFIEADFDRFDTIYAMDKSNYTNIIALASSEDEKKKVGLILNENPNISDKNVPDPYYGGDSGFDYVFEILEDTCEIIANRILN